MIAIDGLHKTYRDEGGAANHVLRGIDLAIADGELVALMGQSGSGKTTLLNVIGALDQGYTGRVAVAGQDLRKLGDTALSRFRNRTVAYVFQQFHLLSHLPVADNVAMPSWFDRDETRSRTELRAHASDVLAKVGLAHKIDARPNHLSGGEKQRVAIARALFNRPRLLLCDEPTGALDSATSAQVMALLLELNADLGITLVVVTHEEAIAHTCRRIVRITDGAIAAASAAGEGAT